jgi:hypothetical protein
MRRLAPLLWLLTAPAAWAGTVVAASLGQSDVQQAIDAAQTGDTVLLPAGTSLWSSPVTLTRGIHLRGAGKFTTVIQRVGTKIRIALTADAPLRISDIGFDGMHATAVNDAYHIDFGGGVAVSDFRIDHCDFRYGERGIEFVRTASGVVDHCTFYNPDQCFDITRVEANDVNNGDQSWSQPLDPGGRSNTIVIEDNVITFDNNLDTLQDEVIYGIEGGRCVFRHNIVDATARTLYDTVIFDQHGQFIGSRQRGTRFYEVYENDIHIAKSYRFGNTRGGTAIYFNNRMIADQGTPSFLSLWNEGFENSGTYNPLDEHQNCHYWNNTINGQPVVPHVQTAPKDHTPYVIENVHYFNRAPQPGDPLYPYVPLPYPHPRVVADDADGGFAMIDAGAPDAGLDGGTDAGSQQHIDAGTDAGADAGTSGVTSACGCASSSARDVALLGLGLLVHRARKRRGRCSPN